ncbi:MAG: DUF134 domain-containing protein [Lachnospiraceae bacterium]|nr:DUF134 domain-containing protein [Lachnospiraceae bacterium]
MARPCKRRRVCEEPFCSCYGPLDQSRAIRTPVVMTVDEFECIRLIDLVGLTQEECAKQMNVARTTVQTIYGSARRKMAESLVKSRNLCIEGGEYMICEGNKPECVRSQCRQNGEERSDAMKIAVTYEEGQVFQHFGHTECFKVYTIEEGKVAGAEVIDTNGQGHGALAGFLLGQKVDALICGGIGGGARQALAQIGVQLYPGVSGDADEAVDAFLKGKLAFNPDASCSHHGSAESHTCGHHGSAESHTCGHHGSAESHTCGHHGSAESHTCGHR